VTLKDTNRPKLQPQSNIEHWIDDVNLSTRTTLNYRDSSTPLDDAPQELAALLLGLPESTLNGMYMNLMLSNGFSPTTGSFPGAVTDDTEYGYSGEDEDEEDEHILENVNGKRGRNLGHEDAPKSKLRKQ
jgi:hypothetical protein